MTKIVSMQHADPEPERGDADPRVIIVFQDGEHALTRLSNEVGGFVQDFLSGGGEIGEHKLPEGEQWANLRAERDRLLAASDWVILRNLETSEPVPEAWLAYRQALRDLPENTDDPADPVWPVNPVG